VLGADRRSTSGVNSHVLGAPPRLRDTGAVSPIRRVLAILVVWGAATAFAAAFAVGTAVGPVLLTLTRRHGVHVGDMVALVAAYTVAAVLTRHLLQQR
jgi:hypothetical protein